MARRFLILTASVGEGHDRPALHLAAQLASEDPDAEVSVVDCLPALGRAVSLVGERAPRIVFYRFRWLWDVGYWAFARVSPTRELTQRLVTRLARPGFLDLVAGHRPDVVVSLYPAATDVLGRLKRRGEIAVPVVAGITDLAALDYWASRGVDLHLVTHPESIDEVHGLIGSDQPVHTVSGFVAPEFSRARDTAGARSRLSLPLDGHIVLVSGGGWGVGDVQGAAEVALALPSVSQVVALCGRNDGLRAALELRFAGEPRVRVEGFTEVMWEWMAAADALVHSTGGLTILEAIMQGCAPISYGWGRGHVRVNNAAFVRHGLAQVARTKPELSRALNAAFAADRSANGFADLPSAASFVLAAADAR